MMLNLRAGTVICVTLLGKGNFVTWVTCMHLVCGSQALENAEGCAQPAFT